MMANYKNYLFSVTGGFDVDDTWKPVLDCNNVVSGFERPDGTIVDLAICLRTEKNGAEKFHVSDNQLAALGFECLDYASADFTESTDETA
jgi:hypothetical protein